jgi:type IV pilus assembly protein PilW
VQAGTTPRSLVLDNGVGIVSGDYVLGAPNAGGCLLSVLGATSPALPPTFDIAPSDASGSGFVGTSNVFDLGARPIVALYGVDTSATPNAFTRYDVLTGAQDSVADGVVMLKALYGVDDGASHPDIAGSGTANDDVIDEWVQPTGAWDYAALMAGTPDARAAIGQIKAVRIAIVAQSELPERASDYSGPETLDLFADAGANKYTMRISPQFRYKVYDTTIPIRNALVTRFF